eukprot:TRINITY_DN4744_c0_g1_i17.p3 TRINITY_DN4744_c0_g1~~TRINITY_DN4744_c0_g1_i17.p3  ORF type:complete len:105 (+),score=19.77 TRINITY_DN4744_c0_g1_i17:700-1014(+)
MLLGEPIGGEAVRRNAGGAVLGGGCLSVCRRGGSTTTRSWIADMRRDHVRAAEVSWLQKTPILLFSDFPYSALIPCLLYTSDAADEEDSVDLGGRRIIKKKKKK